MSILDTLLSTNLSSPTSASTLTCLGTRTRTHERCGIPFENPLLAASATNSRLADRPETETEEEKGSPGAIEKSWQTLHEAVQSRGRITMNKTDFDLVALVSTFLCARHRGVWAQVRDLVLEVEEDITRYERDRREALYGSAESEEKRAAEDGMREPTNRNNETPSGQKLTKLDSIVEESPQERVQSWIRAVHGAEACNKMTYEPGSSALHLNTTVQLGTYNLTTDAGSRGILEAQQSAFPRGFPSVPQFGLYGFPMTTTTPQPVQLHLPVHQQMLGPWSLPPSSPHIIAPGSSFPENAPNTAAFASEPKQCSHAQRKPLTASDECPICLEGLLVPEQRKGRKRLTWCRRQCGTNFHSACIRKWRKRNDSTTTGSEAILVQTQTCPACRVESTWTDWFGTRGYSRH